MPTNQITVKRLVAVLKKVPEKKFRVIELAPLLINEAGRPDPQKCIEMEGEINLAIAEVTSYVSAVRHALGSVQRMKQADMDAREEEFGDDDDEDDEE